MRELSEQLYFEVLLLDCEYLETGEYQQTHFFECEHFQDLLQVKDKQLALVQRRVRLVLVVSCRESEQRGEERLPRSEGLVS